MVRVGSNDAGGAENVKNSHFFFSYLHEDPKIPVAYGERYIISSVPGIDIDPCSQLGWPDSEEWL